MLRPIITVQTIPIRFRMDFVPPHMHYFWTSYFLHMCYIIVLKWMTILISVQNLKKK